MGSYKNSTRKILHLSRTLIGLALQPWRNQTCLISYILYSTRLEAVGWERIGLVQAPPISTLQGSHYVRFFYCVYGGHSRGKPPTFLCPCNGKEYPDSAPSLSLRHLALAQPRPVKSFAVHFLLSPFSMPYCTIVSNRSIGFCIAPSTRNDGATLFPRYPYISPATAPSRQSSSGCVFHIYVQ